MTIGMTERRHIVDDRSKVRTCLWFNDQALPAAEFYCSLLPGSRVERIEHYPEGHAMGEACTVAGVEFILGGTPYLAINGGTRFTLDEAVSIMVTTGDQAETDRLWEALTAGGGSESRCGWLKDRYGLSWQIVPERSLKLMYGAAAVRVWPVLMKMKKIDIAALEAVAEGR